MQGSSRAAANSNAVKCVLTTIWTTNTFYLSMCRKTEANQVLWKAPGHEDTGAQQVHTRSLLLVTSARPINDWWRRDDCRSRREPVHKTKELVRTRSPTTIDAWWSLSWNVGGLSGANPTSRCGYSALFDCSTCTIEFNHNHWYEWIVQWPSR